MLHEALEPRLILDGTGLDLGVFPEGDLADDSGVPMVLSAETAENARAPNLDLSAVAVQPARVGQSLAFNLYTLGAQVTDLDANGNPTNDAIRLQLDPDETPAGATLTASGMFRWTPTTEQVGVFEFIVLAVDAGTPRRADAEVFVIEVSDGNQAPNLAAIPDAQVTRGQLLEVTVTATDPDGDSLTFDLDRDDPGTNLPSGATIQPLTNNTAVIRWTPTASDASGDYTFAVLVTDNRAWALSDREVFTVTVQATAAEDAQNADSGASVAANDVSVAFGDAYYTDANSVLNATTSTGVLANDSDADGDALAATLVSGPAHGSLMFNGDGSFEYTPDVDFSGTDSFVYSASDGSSDPAAEAAVTLHVGDDFGPVIITEFVATGNETLADADGDYPDWIEVHNLSDQSVSLEGWSLTDKEGEAKWLFPAVNLDAGGYLVVFASGKDRTDPAGQLHTNFKLSGDGDYLAIQKPDGTVTSQFAPEYPEQRYGYSYGFVAAGTAEYLAPMTPGNANTAAAIRFVGDVAISQDAGFYTAPFTVTLSVPTDGAAIRYTTDGSAPTATTGVEYTGPLTVSTTTVLRAAAFKDGYVTEAATTRTYVFAAAVITQSNETAIAAGFPATWGTQTADYAIDQTIAAQDGTDAYEGKYAATILSDLQAIPTISLVLDTDDMFGTDGICTNPGSRGDEWERPVSIEYIDPHGTDAGFQINAGIQIQGGISRTTSIKQSFQLKFKSEYGAKTLSYPLFGEGAADEFNSLTLRSSGGEMSSKQYIRDTFGRASQLAAGDAASHGQFVHVYINGLYWGMYELVEHIDETFAANYYGSDPENWDVINAGNLGDEKNTAVAGTLDAWNTLLTMTAELKATADPEAKSAQYHKILGQNPDGTDHAEWDCYLDVDNYIDYLIVEWYGQNSDWPQRNFYMLRERGAESTGFKFVVWDSEFTLDAAASGPSGSTTSLETFGANQQLGPAPIFQGLYSCDEFRARFSERVQALFSEGGAFYVDPNNSAYDPAHPEQNVPAARYAELASQIQAAIVAETARWGDTSSRMGGGGGVPGGGGIPGGDTNVQPDSALGDDPHADAAGATATVLQVGQTPATVTTYLDIAGDADAFQFTAGATGTYRIMTLSGDTALALRVQVLDATLAVVASNESATDMRGLQVTVTEGQTYYVLVTAVDGQAMGQYTLTVSHDTGVPDGGGFPGGGVIPGGGGQPDSALGDDPHADEAGATATVLQVGQTPAAVTTYLDTAGDADAFQFTAGAAGTYRLMAMSGDTALALRVQVLDATLAVVAWNETATDMRGLQVTVTEGQTYYVLVTAADGQATGQYTLTVAADAGVPGGVVPGDGALPGDGGLPDGGAVPGGGTTGTVFTRDEVWQVTVDSLLTTYFPSRSAAFLAQLRAADLYRDSPVVTPADGAVKLAITELNFHPTAPTDAELAVNANFEDEDFEFLEITNIGDQPVDLAGYEFDAGVTFVFPKDSAATPAPGASVVLVSNTEAFAARYGASVNVAGQYTGRLNNGGEQLRLLNAVDTVILDFEYDDADGWPAAADGDGYTLELASAAADPNTAEAWHTDLLGGSPGRWDALVDQALEAGL